MGTLYPPYIDDDDVFMNLSLATSSGEVAARALVLGDHSVSGMEALEAEGSKASLRSAIGRPTLDEHLNFSGLGPFQGRLFAMLSLIVVADRVLLKSVMLRQIVSVLAPSSMARRKSRRTGSSTAARVTLVPPTVSS